MLVSCNGRVWRGGILRLRAYRTAGDRGNHRVEAPYCLLVPMVFVIALQLHSPRAEEWCRLL